jgi:hypothetical protein
MAGQAPQFHMGGRLTHPYAGGLMGWPRDVAGAMLLQICYDPTPIYRHFEAPRA